MQNTKNLANRRSRRILDPMRKLTVLHPFLFAAFFILAVYAANMGEVTLSELVIPLLIAVGSVLALFVVSRLLLKDVNKAGIIVSIFVILFFSYGHVSSIVASHLPSGKGLVLPLSAIFLLLAVYLAVRTRWNLRKLTTILSVIGACLVLMSLVRIGVYEIRRPDSVHGVPAVDVDLHEPDQPPDIYYIILDAYASSDHLIDAYDYDNGAFIEYLSGRGFYVSSESRSNYSMTWLSLPSSLNMDYIDTLVSRATLASQDVTPLSGLVENSRVANLLKSVGYSYVSFNTWSNPTRGGANADLAIDVSGTSLTPFQGLIVENSLASLVWHETVNYREHVLKSFEMLAEMPAIQGPKFVFAHIMCPHWPYVFDADGNPIDPIDWSREPNHRKKWLDQISFVNKKVEVMVDQILSASSVPPIIILQGDHGIRLTQSTDEGRPTEATARDSLEILNALYLPQGGDALMYEAITPVNTFRVILNFYFDADLPLLDDESFLSDMGTPFSLVNVTDLLD